MITETSINRKELWSLIDIAERVKILDIERPVYEVEHANLEKTEIHSYETLHLAINKVYATNAGDNDPKLILFRINFYDRCFSESRNLNRQIVAVRILKDERGDFIQYIDPRGKPISVEVAQVFCENPHTCHHEIYSSDLSLQWYGFPVPVPGENKINWEDNNYDCGPLCFILLFLFNYRQQYVNVYFPKQQCSQLALSARNLQQNSQAPRILSEILQLAVKRIKAAKLPVKIPDGLILDPPAKERSPRQLRIFI
jgi:hypothetical protein